MRFFDNTKWYKLKIYMYINLFSETSRNKYETKRSPVDELVDKR